MPILDDTRSDWNARQPLRPRTTVPWADRVGVSWHWIGPGKGPSPTGSHQRCLDQVRDWQLQHQANGWKDLGYNALICQHARAIEGRGLEYSGSHSPGVNYEHVGVQLMVGDASGPPTPAMLARAAKLRSDVGDLGKNIRRDWSHKDDPKAQTECAGLWITKWVHDGGPTNQEDEDMPLTDADVDRILNRKLTLPNGNTGTVGELIAGANLYSWRASKGVVDVAAVAKAVIASLPAGAGTVNVDALAKAIVVELGKD